MNDFVHALAVFDDGSGAGPALYAGGDFSSAGGQSASRIAKWDGQSWSPLSSGLNGFGSVRALAVFDDGSGAGPALYAGGLFMTAGATSANMIAKWDGQSWSPLLSGANDWVLALTVFDDGSGAGPALYVGGNFTSAGGVSANRIARWDGQSWSALSLGLNGSVRALTVFDDGSGAGPALYAGGNFTSAGGTSANRIARWDGQSWRPLLSGTNDWVLALTVFDDRSGTEPALCAAGTFSVSPGGDSYLAKWGCPGSPIEIVPGCFGNPAVLTSLSNELSIGSTFTVSLASSQFSTGLGLLYAGSDGTDAAGCGLYWPGFGELLLGTVPQPAQLAAGILSAGSVEFALPVPDSPGLVGFQIAFHGIAVGLSDPGVPIEFSNGLLATIAR